MIGTLKSGVQGVFRKCGYEVIKLPRRETKADYPHEEVRPDATYAPWNADPDFAAALAAVRNHTLVDLYRCWELWTLAGQTAKLNGALIEIGVWRGGTGALIARKAELCGVKDPVYLCDTFSGVVKAGDNDSAYSGGEHSDTSRKVVEQLVGEVMNLSNVKILQGIFPDDTAHTLEAENTRFRLCHIDVDVYQSAKDVVRWIWGRMVVGGVVVYDDYGGKTTGGVTKFVNEQLDEKDRLVLHNLNGHAVVIKLA